MLFLGPLSIGLVVEIGEKAEGRTGDLDLLVPVETCVSGPEAGAKR
jgi:hypothetical protein